MEDNQKHNSQLELTLAPSCSEEWAIKNVSKNNLISETGNYNLSHKHLFINNSLRSTQILKIQTRPQGLSQPCEFNAISANTDAPNTPQKRVAPSVVGWPPIRFCRKNLAIGISSKSNSEIQNSVTNAGPDEKRIENSKRGLFVKINMDGVPIGRKVDLKAYNGYEKLSAVVDDLFRDLLAAQSGIESKQMGEKEIMGLLDGSGEYTLIYEDNDGDNLLVGDVPWEMFISAVKRLRVLKRSEISKLCTTSKQKKKSIGIEL